MDLPQANSADQSTALPSAATGVQDRVEVDPATSAPPPLRANSTLGDAMTAFDEYMLGKGFSDNTIKAFRNEQEATAFAKSLQDKGHPVVLTTIDVPGKGQFWRVRLGPYDTLDDARAAQRKFEAAEGHTTMILASQ